MTSRITPQDVLGVILAGGQGRRMGGDGDKPLTPLGNGTLLSSVLDRATPQCGPMIINANSDPARYASYGLPVVPDRVEGFVGPLAGVLTAMDWAAMKAPSCRYVMSFAGDAPFIPRNLVSRLTVAVDAGAELARARSFGQRHPVFGLWPVKLRAELRDQLVNQGIRKIDLFTADYRVEEVDFDGVPDPFFNVNTPEDRDEAERILQADKG